MGKTAAWAWLLIAAWVVSGCATTTPQNQVTELRRLSPDPKIVLMPMDVELHELTVGGILEPKAEWTKRASQLLAESIRSEKKRIGFDMIEFSRVDAGTDVDTLDQLNKLHGAVGRSILMNRLPALRLPNKGDTFDWSLGPDVKLLRQRSSADYALFVFVRDSYASDARKVAMVAGALIGVSMQGGTQVGFASLVDLESGDVVWFNHLARGTGDLRTPEPALETVKLLLSGFPK